MKAPSHDAQKVVPPSLTDKQILIEERFDNYPITYLPSEIIEMILADVIKFSKNSTETYVMNILFWAYNFMMNKITRSLSEIILNINIRNMRILIKFYIF